MWLIVTNSQCQYDHLQAIFLNHKPKELHRITSINIDVLNELVRFLQPFKDATKACEGEQQPTLHLVIPWMMTLKKHCHASDEDSDALVDLKEKAANFIDKKFTPHVLHKTAIFLKSKTEEHACPVSNW